MVGPINSNPPLPVSGIISDYYGYGWFGELPTNIAAIRDIHHDFFLKVPEYFEEPPSADQSYRSFVLNTEQCQSFNGTSFLHSHIFAYNNQISQAEDYDLVRSMAYEMSHSYLGPPVTSKEIDWLYEGIKSSLSIYMPFRNGFRTGDYFQATITHSAFATIHYL